MALAGRFGFVETVCPLNRGLGCGQPGCEREMRIAVSRDVYLPLGSGNRFSAGLQVGVDRFPVFDGRPP